MQILHACCHNQTLLNFEEQYHNVIVIGKDIGGIFIKWKVYIIYTKVLHSNACGCYTYKDANTLWGVTDFEYEVRFYPCIH